MEDVMNTSEILDATKGHVSTYLKEDDIPIIVAVADTLQIKIGISIQRNYPITLIERSYGIPFGRFRGDASRLLSDPEELHGYKWSVETHERFGDCVIDVCRLQQLLLTAVQSVVL